MSKYHIEQSNTFKKWLKKLTKVDYFRIIARLEKIADDGHLGDYKWLGDIGELRFFFGSGYRIYYTTRDNRIIFLLCAGDKSTQSSDIKKARAMLKDIPKQEN